MASGTRCISYFGGQHTPRCPSPSFGGQLYGGDADDVRRQILAPRHGVMPGWGERLDPATIKMLAAYVHSRGGGEEIEEEAPIEDVTELAVAEGGDEQP